VVVDMNAMDQIWWFPHVGQSCIWRRIVEVQSSKLTMEVSIIALCSEVG
jgi:hypothetical protein